MTAILAPAPAMTHRVPSSFFAVAADKRYSLGRLPEWLYAHTVLSFQHERKKMLRGSCCCGTIKFTLSSPPTMMGTCHCTRCRKSGASTFVFVKRDSFELLSGADSITTYKPEAPYKYNRCFCSHCGTSLGEVTSSSESFPVAANCFDDEIKLTNLFHEFVKEKPDWYGICDEAKQFLEHPHQ